MTDIVVLRRDSVVTFVRGSTTPSVGEVPASIVIIQREGIPGTPASEVGKQEVVVFQIDGGGVPILSNHIVDLTAFPFAAVAETWTLVADVAGDIDLDIQHSTYENYPAFVSMAGEARPTLVGAEKAQDVLIEDWPITQLAQGDILRLRVLSASNVNRATLSLSVRKS